MKRVILVSHGQLSVGLKNSMEMICGDLENVFCFSMSRDDKVGLSNKVKTLISTFNDEDQKIILTDLIGSSVTNEMILLTREVNNMHVISGMNLGLALSISIPKNNFISDELFELVSMAQQQIILYDSKQNENFKFEGDEL